MPESTLSLQLSDFAAEVGQYLGFSRTPQNWTGWDGTHPYVPSVADSQLGQIMSVIQSGYRSFLYPPLVEEGVNQVYEWSILTPEREISIVAGQTTFDLPEDFRDLVGELNFAPTDSTSLTVREYGIGQVDSALQQYQSLTAKPVWCAIFPKYSDGTMGQRWSIRFAPTPDQNYVLTYTSTLLPQALSAQNPWPLGGSAHGETILESCLAVAETRLNDEQTTHRALFIERLKASISLDRGLRPAYLGPNRDNSDWQEYRYAGWGAPGYGNPYANGPPVTWNGVVPS